MRGGHDIELLARLVTGLIPACAGRTDYAELKGIPLRVDPRVCGADGRPMSPFTHIIG